MTKQRRIVNPETGGSLVIVSSKDSYWDIVASESEPGLTSPTDNAKTSSRDPVTQLQMPFIEPTSTATKLDNKIQNDLSIQPQLTPSQDQPTEYESTPLTRNGLWVILITLFSLLSLTLYFIFSLIS